MTDLENGIELLTFMERIVWFWIGSDSNPLKQNWKLQDNLCDQKLLFGISNARKRNISIGGLTGTNVQKIVYKTIY